MAVFDGCLGARASPVRSKGTSALFVGEKSRVKLDGPVVATADEVRFRFDEVRCSTRGATHRGELTQPRASDGSWMARRRAQVLCFRIPLQPKVPLTGELILKRGDDGLITSYKEVRPQICALCPATRPAPWSEWMSESLCSVTRVPRARARRSGTRA